MQDWISDRPQQAGRRTKFSWQTPHVEADIGVFMRLAAWRAVERSLLLQPNALDKYELGNSECSARGASK